MWARAVGFVGTSSSTRRASCRMSSRRPAVGGLSSSDGRRSEVSVKRGVKRSSWPDARWWAWKKKRVRSPNRYQTAVTGTASTAMTVATSSSETTSGPGAINARRTPLTASRATTGRITSNPAPDSRATAVRCRVDNRTSHRWRNARIAARSSGARLDVPGWSIAAVWRIP